MINILKDIEWSLVADIMVALTALYAAVVSTWALIEQRRATRPKIKVVILLDSYMARPSDLGSQIRKELGDPKEPEQAWIQFNDIIVTALNVGQQEVAIAKCGLMLPSKKILYSEDVRRDQVILSPGRKIDDHTSIERIKEMLPKSVLQMRKLQLIGVYQDQLGHMYLSKPVDLTRIKQVLITD